MGIHRIPVDVVEIERNIIENWLLALRHWIKLNSKRAKMVLLSLLALVVVALLVLFVHNAVIEKQSSQYFSAIGKYDEALKKNETEKDKALNELLADTTKLCHATWSTEQSNSGCLLTALIHLELKHTREVAESLKTYATHSGSKALKAYTAFYAAYNYENSDNLDDAYKLYGSLQNILKGTGKEDIALFHQARIEYYRNNLKEASKLIDTILNDYKTSNYTQEAKKYKKLIELKKSQPST